MKKSLLIFSLLLVTLFGCEERYPIGAKFFTYEDIPQTISLKGERLDIPELQNPRDVLFLNDKLFISDNHAGFKIHVVALDDSLTYVNRLGVEGVGPGEFTHVWKMEPASEKDHIWAFDIQTKKYHKFSAYQESPKALIDFRQPNKLLEASELVWVSDNLLVGRSEFGEGKFTLYDTIGSKLSAHGDFDNMIEGDWEDVTLGSLFQGRYTSNKSIGKVVSTSIRADILEIFDVNTKSIITVSGPVNEVNPFKIVYAGKYPMPASYSEDDKTYYFSSYPGENYIFAIYLGLNDKEINASDVNSEIIVFDYKGNPTIRLILDAYVDDISVDEKNRMIYGVTRDEEPSIIAYKYDF